MDNPHLDSNFENRLSNLPRDLKDRYLDRDKMGLTIYQRFAMPIIRWLYFGQIGSGRTEVLAHVFIQRAIETEDKVHLFDHSGHTSDDRARGHRFMMERIDFIMKHCYTEYEYRFSLANMSLKVWKRKQS